jgi:lysophospholipase L1-like esterase
LPSLTLVNPRGTTQTANQLAEYEHWIRRGYTPQDGSTISAGRQLFTGQPDTPPALETPLTAAQLAADPTMRAAFVSATADGLDRLSATRASVLLPFHAALANRDNAGVSIGVLGDSITEGQGATAFDRRWIARLRDSLRARYPTTGLTGGGRGFIAGVGTGQTTFTWPTTRGGGPTTSTGFGPKRASLNMGAGTSVTFTLTGTSCDLYCFRGTTGVLSVTVDGGTATNVDTTGTALDGIKYRIPLGAAGAHTVVVAYASGGNSRLHGVIEYNGDETKGIQVHDCGHFGWNTGSGAAGWIQTGSTWQPSVAALARDLLVIALGTNDGSNGITAAQHATNLTTLIAALRAAYTTIGATAPPIALVPYGGPSNMAGTWADYVAAEKALAAADPAMIVLDLSLRLPNAATNTVGLYADGTGHPADRGHGLIGDLVAQLVSPR